VVSTSSTLRRRSTAALPRGRRGGADVLVRRTPSPNAAMTSTRPDSDRLDDCTGQSRSLDQRPSLVDGGPGEAGGRRGPVHGLGPSSTERASSETDRVGGAHRGRSNPGRRRRHGAVRGIGVAVMTRTRHRARSPFWRRRLAVDAKRCCSSIPPSQGRNATRSAARHACRSRGRRSRRQPGVQLGSLGAVVGW